MSTTTELVALLAPWMQVLATRTELQYGDRSLPVRYDKVAFAKVRTDHAYDVRVFEALELLALLSYVDASAWGQALKQAWDAEEVELIKDCCGAEFQLACELAFEEGHTATIPSWCERVVMGGPEWTASREYIHARTLLETALKREEEQERPCVEVHLTSEREDHDNVLTQFARVVALQQVRDSTHGPFAKWDPLFRVVYCNMFWYWPDGTIMTNRWFALIAQMARCGVQHRGLHVNGIPIEKATAPLHVPGLQVLLHTNLITENGRGGVTDILLGGLMTRQAIASVFSAVFSSNSATVIAVNSRIEFETIADRLFFWRWFALAVLSNRTRMRLDYFSISLHNLRDNEAIVAIRDIQSSPNPVAALHTNDSDDSVVPAQPRRVGTASRFTLVPPTSAQISSEDVIVCENQEVCVLEELQDGWYAVLLPGWGQAWTRHQDMTNIRYESGTTATEDRGERSRLNLVNMDDITMPTALDFLRIVGPRLSTLSIGVVAAPSSLDPWLAEAVRLCPSLEHFSLFCGCKLRSLESLSGLFERGDCKLQRIQLDEITIQDTDHIHHFFQLLTDSSHPMTKTLRSFD